MSKMWQSSSRKRETLIIYTFFLSYAMIQADVARNWCPTDRHNAKHSSLSKRFSHTLLGLIFHHPVVNALWGLFFQITVFIFHFCIKPRLGKRLVMPHTSTYGTE